MKYYILERDDEDGNFLALQIDPVGEGRTTPYFGFIFPQSILSTFSLREAKVLCKMYDKEDMFNTYHIVPRDELQLFFAEQKLRRQ
jgi:hypothetical protein